MMDWRRPPPDPSPDLPPSDSSSLLSRWLDLLSQVGTEAKESLIVDRGGGGRATPSGRSSGASRRARNRGDRESPFFTAVSKWPSSSSLISQLPSVLRLPLELRPRQRNVGHDAHTELTKTGTSLLYPDPFFGCCKSCDFFALFCSLLWTEGRSD